MLQRLTSGSTWHDEKMRTAAIKALIYRLLAPSAVVLSLGGIGSMVAAGAAWYQVREMGLQTEVMSRSSGEQIRGLKEQTDIMQKASEAQRSTELMQMFYGAATPAPVRTMALQELLEIRPPYLDLTAANLALVRVTGGDFSKLDMSRSILTEAKLPAAEMHQTNLTGAKLERAVFGSAQEDMTGRNMADLADARLVMVEGESADFTMAMMLGADLTGARLVNADFSNTTGSFIIAPSGGNAPPEFCDLPGRAEARMEFVVESGMAESPQETFKTDLTGATFWHATWGNAELRGTILKGAQVGGARFVGANLTGADFSASTWDGGVVACTKSRGLNLADSKLTHVDFSESDLERSIFTGSTLEAVDFTGAKLGCADFSGVRLVEGGESIALRFAGADLRKATGLRPEHWARACIDEHTRLPDDVPTNVPRCPASLSPRQCRTADGRGRYTVSDLIELQHFQRPDFAKSLWEGVESRKLHVESDPSR